jgi:hypothetical protein
MRQRRDGDVSLVMQNVFSFVSVKFDAGAFGGVSLVVCPCRVLILHSC